MGRHQYIEGD